MQYPTLEQVANADLEQLCRWVRFLDSPGMKHVGTSTFEEEMEKEVEVMDEILSRFNNLGGFTPEISKRIGHG